MENRVKEISIEKYYNALIELKKVLNYTNRISLDDFCAKNQLSKNLPRVLQKGGVIKCITKGKYSQWEWTTIEPTKQMAVKSIQMLGILNPPRKKAEIKPTLENKKTKEIKSLPINENKKILISLFWGLIKFELC